MTFDRSDQGHSLMDTLADEYVFAGTRLLECGAPLPALSCSVKALHITPGRKDAGQLAEMAAKHQADPPPEVSDGEVERLIGWVKRLDNVYANQRHVAENGLTETLGFLLPGPGGDAETDQVSDARESLARVVAEVRDSGRKDQEALRSALDDLCVRLDVTEADIDKQGHKKGLVPSFLRSLDTSSDLHNVANTLYKAGRMEEARQCYTIILDHLNPDLIETLFNRALALTRLKQYYQALRDIDRVLELNPNLAEAHYTRGLILEYVEDYDQAIATFKRTLEIDRKYEKARIELDAAMGRKKAKEGGGSPVPSTTKDTEDHQEIRDFSAYIEHPQVALAHVAGCAEAKAEVRKVIAYLDPQHRPVLEEWGADLPTGVLLHGRPGCGKTLLVRACAGEVRCPVYSVPAKDLVSMWAGQTEKNLGHLWEAATRHESAIIHFSEFDHVAGRRTDMRDPSGGEHWANRTINALLDLMDGMKGRHPGLVVIGDTNMVGNIDPALLREGRFGTTIEVKPPADPVEWAEVWLVLLGAEEQKASRVDVFAVSIREALRSDRKSWLTRAFAQNRSDPTGADQSGIADLARLSHDKGLVPADIAGVIRRTKDERALLQIEDEVTLGPISADDLRFHLAKYEPFRDTAPQQGDWRGTMVG